MGKLLFHQADIGCGGRQSIGCRSDPVIPHSLWSVYHWTADVHWVGGFCSSTGDIKQGWPARRPVAWTGRGGQGPWSGGRVVAGHWLLADIVLVGPAKWISPLCPTLGAWRLQWAPQIKAGQRGALFKHEQHGTLQYSYLPVVTRTPPIFFPEPTTWILSRYWS